MPGRARGCGLSKATLAGSGAVPSAPTAGGWSLSARDRTLILWDADTGECITTLILLSEAKAVAHHPCRSRVACGSVNGLVYLGDLVGITLGPLVVTAMGLDNSLAIRCPVCRERHPLQEAWLGREMSCPRKACTARWRVNPFVVRQGPTAGSWLRWWRRS